MGPGAEWLIQECMIPFENENVPREPSRAERFRKLSTIAAVNGRSPLRRLCFCGLFRVFLVVSLNAACGIHQLLPPREERMAGGADFDLQVADRGTRLEGVPANAGDNRLLVFGVDTVSHSLFILSPKMVNR
jgi:hypothetical protein